MLLPADEVPGAEAFLMSYRGGTGKKLPIGGAVQTLKKEEWIGKAFPEFKVKDIEGQDGSKADVTGRPCGLELPGDTRLWSLYQECGAEQMDKSILM